MKPTTTWVLLADGAQAKVFIHSGRGAGLSPVADLKFEDDVLKAGDIMADRPGRSFSSVGDGRSAMEYSTDPVEVRQERFARQVVDGLERRHREGGSAPLIIAAAPDMLGKFRRLMSDRLRAAVVAELPKNLTRLPTEDIETHLDGLLPR